MLTRRRELPRGWFCPASLTGLAALLAFVVTVGEAQTQSSSVLTKRYLLAFHACDTTSTNCDDPRNHQTYLAQSDDGASWSIPSGYTSFSGSVPDVVRRGQTIYVYSPGQVRRFRIDTSTWESPLTVTLTDSEGSFVDPSPIVDENGRIVLFYLLSSGSGDPAQCPSGQSSCVKRFRSATEVDGSDGAQFLADSGDRAQVTLTPTSTQPDTASDPDIFYDGTQYVLYISRGNSMEVYTSSTLRGSFSRSTVLSGGKITDNSGGVGSGFYDALQGQYWTFAHRPETPQSIYRGVHATLASTLSSGSLTAVVTGSGLGLGSSVSVASPGIAENANGPNILSGSPSGTITTPAQIAFRWEDLTRSPVYVLELCAIPTGASTCFASQAGVAGFDSFALTLWLVDAADPVMQSLIGLPLGLGSILPYTRTGSIVSLGPLSLGPLSLSLQYRIFPVVLEPLGLPTGGTSSLPATAIFR